MFINIIKTEYDITVTRGLTLSLALGLLSVSLYLAIYT